MLIDLESVRSLPDRKRSWLPPIEQRNSLKVGDSARLLAVLDGSMPYYPWVTITAVTTTGYVGVGRDVENEISFGPDNVIEI